MFLYICVLISKIGAQSIGALSNFVQGFMQSFALAALMRSLGSTDAIQL